MSREWYALVSCPHRGHTGTCARLFTAFVAVGETKKHVQSRTQSACYWYTCFLSHFTVFTLSTGTFEHE